MALLHWDGFDHDHINAAGQWGWDTTGPASQQWFSGRLHEYQTATKDGSLTGFLQRAASPISPNNLEKNLTVAAGGRIFLGFALRHNFYTTGVNTSNTVKGIIVFYAGASVAQITVGLDTLGLVTVWRGTTAGTKIAASTQPIKHGVSAFWEIKVKIDGTAGEVEVRIEGETVVSFVGNTAATAGTTAPNKVRYTGSTQSTNDTSYTALEDFYICDETGSAPTNTFLGPGFRVITITANSDIVDEWSHNLSTNWVGLSDENSAASYYSQPIALGSKIVCGLGDPYPGKIATILQVRGFQLGMDTAATPTAQIEWGLLDGAGNYSLGAVQVMTTAYRGSVASFATAPDSGAWDATKVNDLRFQAKANVL